MLGPAVLGGLLLVLLRHRRRARATFLSVVDDNAQSVALKPAFLPPTRTVAVFTSAFDPISSSELRMAAELCNLKAVDAVILAPYGKEYASMDTVGGGLTALSRFTLCHLGVESTLPSTCPVSVINPSYHSLTTVEIKDNLRAWAKLHNIELVWVLITPPDCSGLCDVRLSADPSATPTSAQSTAPPPRLHRVYSTTRSAISKESFQARMRLSTRFSVYGLVPPLVMSAIKRYGMYRDATRAPFQASVGWYADGWSRFVEFGRAGPPLPPSDAPTPRAKGGSTDASEDLGGDVLYRSTTASRHPLKTSNRIAIYGGSFSPIAVHHLEVAAELINTGTVDEVWVVPCGPRPDKPELEVSAYTRFVQAVIAVEATVSASVPIYVVPVEVPHAKALASYSLASGMPALFPAASFELVIGSDLFPTLHRWQCAKPLLEEVNFIVVERPGYPAAAAVAATPSHLLPSHYRRLELPHSLQLCLTSLSSTELRARIQGGGAAAGGEADCVGQDWALAGLLPLPVLSFVNRYGLYGLCPVLPPLLDD